MGSLRAALTALTAAVTLGAGVLAGPATADTVPSPWLQDGYNAAGSNANTIETTLTPAAVAQATLLRTLPAARGGCPAFVGANGSPLLSDQRVYTVSGTTLTARDAGTGAQLWSTQLPAFSAYTTVAVSHGLVVLSGNDCGTTDPVGVVIAVNSADGSPAYTLNSPYDDAVTGVSVSDRYLIVRSSEVGGEVDLTVYALIGGAQQWTLTGVTGDSGLQAASSRVVGGKVFTQELNDAGFAVQQGRDLATGAVAWTDQSPLTVERGDDDVAGTHLLGLGLLGLVTDVDPATGATRYTLGSATHTLAVDPARVYAACAADATIVCAFDRETGRRLWVRGVGRAATGAITAAGVLYLSSGVVLNAANGHKIRTLPGQPVAVGQGRIAVLRPSGALQLWGLAGS